MTPAVTIRPGTPDEARHLIAASHRLMEALFPAESNHHLDIAALSAPEVRFFVAEAEGRIAGCAALVPKEGYGEVKSMFVDPAMRGYRIGARLLDRLEQAARALGLPLLRLETGDRLTAAIRLYTAHGFRQRGPFGDYRDDPLSIFMEKRL